MYQPPPRLRRLMTLVIAAMVAFATLLVAPGVASAHTFKILLFSKTTGFRHASIPTGIAAIQKLGLDNDFTVDATEDDAAFTDTNLAQYQAVVFLSATGDPLTTQDRKDAFQRYVRGGGGFVGIHAASDSMYSWSWYGGLVGAYFKSHPAVQNATVRTEDSAHLSNAGLPGTYIRNDEWYDFQSNPRGKVHVLASLDNSSYSGSTMGTDHPISWCQNYDGGRSWYTGMGHTDASFSEPNFLKHLLGGIRTAAGDAGADCSALPADTAFQKVALDTNTSNPMALDIAKDGRVFYVDRMGDINVIKTTGSTVRAAHLDVFTSNEAGLLNLALDPNFATNKWIYIYYSPSNGGDFDRLSRFTVSGDTIDLATEKVVLNVPAQRAQCCHHGVGMVFDKTNGNLWLSTGDNTNPFDSSGYTPIDERAGRGAWDAQRTSGNTNNLIGKVLRIHPEADGTYTIPSGNMWPAGTAQTKPEIYSMGYRNPFRMGLDPKTGFPLVANYGPDAGSASTTRGPQNTVEWDVLSTPVNAGWPYCIGNNTPYNDYDFATGVSGALFDCAGGPTNNSPNNTGLSKLPAATPATVYYHYNADPNKFPELSGGAPMAGPVYRYDPNLVSDRKWPATFEGRAFFAEWNNSSMFTFQLDPTGKIVQSINRLLGSMAFLKPMDFKFGPDGALYLVEWGSGFGGSNADSGIYRIDYAANGFAPVAKASANKTDGAAPLTVTFSSAGSSDPAGQALTYAWNFGDGTTGTGPSPSHTYAAGNYTAILTVTNTDGRTGTSSVVITSGNTMPVVTIQAPPAGGLFAYDEYTTVRVSASDPDGGTIDCNRVTIQAILVHDTHGHPLQQATGCSASMQLVSAADHPDTSDVSYAFEATYTDTGGTGGSAPLTGRAYLRLQPKHKQAEHFAATGRISTGQGTDDPGVRVETASEGGASAAYIQDGDWFDFDPLALNNITSLRVRASSGGIGGTLEVRWNATDGPLLGSVTIPSTGGWQNWRDFTTTLTNPPTGTGKLYFVAHNPAGTTGANYLFNVNWVDFIGDGVSSRVVSRAATVTASSVFSTQYAAANAVDGVSGQWGTGEWASSHELNPWLRLDWTTPQVVDRVTFYDRSNLTDWAPGGTLTFSDGSTVSVSGIPNNGTAKTVTFPSKNISWVRFQVAGGSGSNVGLSEIEVSSKPNVATSSTKSASTVYSTQYAVANATDGVIGQNGVGEWASAGQQNPWIKLDWSSAQTVDRVVFYDRPNTSDWAPGGTLTFSDGTTVAVSGIPNDGAARVITFPAKSTTSVTFQVSGGTGPNVGLSEVQVY